MSSDEGPQSDNGQSASARPDLLVEEYGSIRDEIMEHERSKTRWLGLAITATSAIGAFALGKEGNQGALLVLPLVLSGIGIIYLKHSLDIDNLGEYIRTSFWPATRSVLSEHDTSHGTTTFVPWDIWIEQHRGRAGRASPYGSLGFLPPILILAAPSVASLVLTLPSSKSAGWAFVWSADVVALITVLVLSVWVGIASPGWKRKKQSRSA